MFKSVPNPHTSNLLSDLNACLAHVKMLFLYDFMCIVICMHITMTIHFFVVDIMHTGGGGGGGEKQQLAISPAGSPNDLEIQ